MAQVSIFRLAIPAAVLYLLCCAMALGQTGPANGPGSQGTSSVYDPPPSSAQMLHQNRGSLLRATVATQSTSDKRQPNLFHVNPPEPRTLKKHDLVTIIVREQSEYSSEAKADFNKEASIDAQLDEWIKLNVKNLEMSGGGITAPVPRVAAQGEREFQGDGKVDRSDRLITRITAEVLDVKPNGTLVLQARSRIKTDDEVQQLILSGTCRVEDISADNTILSTQIFDFDLEKTHTGGVRDATKRGFLTKFVDWLNPF